MEELKDIEWYVWTYKISNLWYIKSLKFWKEKIIKNRKWKEYFQVWLSINWIQRFHSVHRILAIAFIPNPNNYPVVNHIDWNKLNNSIDNLEWCTNSDNINHAYKMWLKKSPFYWVSYTSKKVNQYTKDGIFIKEWWSTAIPWRYLNIQRTNIARCCRWKLKTAWWFIWKYA